MEYHNQFLREIEAIKPYFIEFEKDSSIKSKIYLENYAIKGLNLQPIIFIIHNKSIFNVNNCQRQVWQKKTILYSDPKVNARVL